MYRIFLYVEIFLRKCGNSKFIVKLREASYNIWHKKYVKKISKKRGELIYKIVSELTIDGIKEILDYAEKDRIENGHYNYTKISDHIYKRII